MLEAFLFDVFDVAVTPLSYAMMLYSRCIYVLSLLHIYH